MGQKVLWARAQIARVPNRAVNDGRALCSFREGRALSDADAEAYIAVEFGTNANEQARKHGKATLDLVIGLHTKRSAMWRDVAMCWRLPPL